ncbi:MAG: filamentous hemagglutinin N-terminal domain-containing protein [Burkholderiaceae bacterium]
MNPVYRLVPGSVHGLWGRVSGTAQGQGKVGGRVLLAAMAAFGAACVQAGPTGGQVAGGSGSIVQQGQQTTVVQNSPTLSLNWQGFNIGADERVSFVQPSAAAIAVNRIADLNGSKILGRLDANGQVWLINPNGILFGRGAQVSVGSLVASTLAVGDDGLVGSGSRRFGGSGSGSVVNQGTITAADGGHVVLLAHQVTNEGTISARLGTVALGAGSAATLSFTGNRLLQVQVDASLVDSLVDNGGLIRADGGQVLMSAGARDSLLASVVNNTGVVEARTVEQQDGRIVLLGGMAAGTTRVAGALDASAPDGGHGGFVETSAAHVKVAEDARITTTAARGQAGTWLIDPMDFNIAVRGGDITGTALSTQLAGGNVTIQSTGGGSGTAGDVNVGDAVTWSANKLTLNAQNNINLNASLTGAGTASVALEYGQGALAAANTSTYNVRAPITLPAGPNFTTKLGSDGTVKSFTVITDLGVQGSTTGSDLQGMNGNVNANYALGSDIDASITATWDGGAGFVPIGTASNFAGTFDGLGHVVSGLVVNRPSSHRVGLFGVSNGADFQNVGIVGGTFKGLNYVGSLVGDKATGNIVNAYATSAVSGVSWVGGLAGLSNGGDIRNSFATGSVSGTGQLVGGLIGQARFYGALSNSYATGAVDAGTAYYVGGLVGQARFVSVSNAYATGTVTGNFAVGGLVGYLDGTTISNSYATGYVNSYSGGGLVGASNRTVTNSYWNTETSGQGSSAGGIGLTTAQMQQAGNFNGWDFSTTWFGHPGQDSPLLRALVMPLTVTAVDAAKTYDGQAFAGGSGVRYSSTPQRGLISGTVSYGGSAQAATDAGTYSITPGGLVYIDPQRHALTFVDGALTIGQAALTVTAHAASKTYDGAAYSGGNGVTYGGLVNGETSAVLGGALGYTGSSQGAVDVGSYVLTPQGLSSGNYQLSYVDGALSIDPAIAPVIQPGPVPDTLSANITQSTHARFAPNAGVAIGSPEFPSAPAALPAPADPTAASPAVTAAVFERRIGGPKGPLLRRERNSVRLPALLVQDDE